MPHRMHEMRTIAVDDPDVCQSLSASCGRLCENGRTDRRPVWGENLDPRYIVLDGVHVDRRLWGAMLFFAAC